MLIFRFSSLIKGFRSSLLMNYLLILLSTLFFVATPIVIEKTLGFVQDGEVQLAVIGIIFMLMSTLLGILFNYLSSQFGLNHFSGVDAATQKESFASLIKNKISFYEKQGAGEILQKMDAFRRLSYLMLTDMIGSFVKLTAVVMCIIVMANQSVILTLVFFVLLSVLLVVQLLFSNIVAEAKYNLMGAQADRMNALNSFLHNIHFIRSSGKRAHHFDILNKASTAYINRHSRLSYLSNVDNILSNGSIIFLELCVIITAVVLMGNGKLSEGSLLAFFAYKAFLMTNLNDVLYFLSSLFSVSADINATKALVGFYDEPTSYHDKEVSSCKKVVSLSIRDVAYMVNDKWLFSGVSFEAKRGGIVVITGPSGAGKSTLLSLMLGVKSVKEGSVSLNGQYEVSDTPSWRSYFSVSLQSDRLFSGTVSDNICMSAAPDDIRLRSICQSLGILDDILSKPLAFEHKITGGVSGFSGGQEQRILLARAIYQNAPILLLDEVTSQLDQQQERKVINYLRSLNKIIVMIAHREACLDAADKVVYISDKSASRVDKQYIKR